MKRFCSSIILSLLLALFCCSNTMVNYRHTRLAYDTPYSDYNIWGNCGYKCQSNALDSCTNPKVFITLWKNNTDLNYELALDESSAVTKIVLMNKSHDSVVTICVLQSSGDAIMLNVSLTDLTFIAYNFRGVSLKDISAGLNNSIFTISQQSSPHYKIYKLKPQGFIRSSNVRNVSFPPQQVFTDSDFAFVYGTSDGQAYYKGYNDSFDSFVERSIQTTKKDRRSNLTSRHIKSSYSNRDNLITRTLQYHVQIFSQGHLTTGKFNLLMSFTLDPEVSKFTDSVTCLGLIFMSTETNKIVVYRPGSWKYLVTISVPETSNTSSIGRLKCFVQQNTLGVYARNTTDGVDMLVFYDLTQQAFMKPSATMTAGKMGSAFSSFTQVDWVDETIKFLGNLTNLTPGTQANTDSTIGTTSSNGLLPGDITHEIDITFNISCRSNSIFTYNQTQCPLPVTPEPIAPEPQKVPLSPKAQYYQQTKASIKEAMQSPAVQATADTMGQISSVASASSLRSILRPLSNLLDDLWLYGYDNATYPQFLVYFTSQVDDMNDIRIKPDFLNFEVQVETAIEYNQQYQSISTLHPGAPESIFMLDSIQDIYTLTALTVCSQFLLILALRVLLTNVRCRLKIIKAVREFAVLNSMWWNLLLGIVEANVANIGFYGGVQFNVLVSLDFGSKLGLAAAVLAVFVAITFSLCFYPLLYRYQYEQTSEQLLDVSTFSLRSFWLEIVFKCLRSFFQALIHGIFTNQSVTCLLLLVLLDVVLLAHVVIYYRSFKYKLIFFLVIMYFLAFLCLDVSLLNYVIEGQSILASDEAKLNYDFLMIVLILILISVTVLRIVVLNGFTVYEMIQGCREANKINNYSQQQDNIQSDENQEHSQISKIMQKYLCKNSLIKISKSSDSNSLSELKQNSLISKSDTPNEQNNAGKSRDNTAKRTRTLRKFLQERQTSSNNFKSMARVQKEPLTKRIALNITKNVSV